MPSNAAAKIFQVGTQSAFDTAVAATAKLAVPDIAFEADDVVTRPQLAKGLAIRSPGNEFVTLRGARWSVPAYECNYEQLAGWFGTIIQGGVSTADVSAPYTWDFVRNILALPSLNLLTLERRLSDFTNHIDEEWLNCVGQELTLSGQADGNVMMSVQGIGSKRTGSTLTASQTMPTVEHAPFSLSEVYIDTSWAGIGGTQIAGQVMQWSVRIMSGAKGLRPADGRSTLDHGLIVYDAREVGAEIRMRLLQDKTRYNAEVAAAEAATLRAIRFGFAGTSSRAANVDVLCKHTAGSLVTVDESDGQVVYDVALQEATDGTNFLAASIESVSDGEWGIDAA